MDPHVSRLVRLVTIVATDRPICTTPSSSAATGSSEIMSETTRYTNHIPFPVTSEIILIKLSASQLSILVSPKAQYVEKSMPKVHGLIFQVDF